METEKDKTKHKITSLDLIMLEKAASLKVLTDFEEKLIQDRLNGVKQYGGSCVITKGQRKVLKELSNRYDCAHILLLQKKGD